MRLAICALSAVLVSGCSWMGSGGGQAGYNQGGGHGAYGMNCGQGGAMGGGQYYGQQSYGQAGGGCGAGGYGMAGHGYGGAGAFGNAAGYGGAGGYGYGANGMGATGQGGGYTNYAGYGGQYGTGTTMLGGAAPYGAAVGGTTGNIVGTQYSNGQYVQGAGVQTIQGAPYYVAQPYPAYYGYNAGQSSGYSYGGGYGYGYGGGFGGGALPFGIEAGIGTEFSAGGDIFPGEVSKPSGTGGTVSALPAISYGDAFDNAMSYDLGATYDLDQTTTVLGRVGYSKAEGNRLLIGQVDDGLGLTEDLYGEFSDLEQVTVEAGIRKYMGGWNNGYTGLRPYIGATGGFVHTDNVDITQSSDTLIDPNVFTQTYIDGGWAPTATGMIGAEYQVGARTAIGVEAGLKWQDDLDTNFQSDDRWSVPVKLRGRVSF